MQLNMLKGKIHRATVVQAELDYVGSITIDEDLMEASGILEYEKVQIVDVNNGQRFETYVIAGEAGSGMICLNGLLHATFRWATKSSSCAIARCHPRKCLPIRRASCSSTTTTKSRV